MVCMYVCVRFGIVGRGGEDNLGPTSTSKVLNALFQTLCLLLFDETVSVESKQQLCLFFEHAYLELMVRGAILNAL